MASKRFSSIFHFSKARILVASLVIISFTAFGIVSTDAHHGLVTKTFDSGLVMISLRDIENTNPPGFTINGEIKSGDLLVTVIDQDANDDLDEPDEVFVRATSSSSGSKCASTFLEETGNPGEFTGIITLSSQTTSGSTLEAGRFDQINLFYEQHPDNNDCEIEGEIQSVGEPTGYARAKATVMLDSGGDVTISDKHLTPNEIENLCFIPVVYPIEISFSNGAVQTPSTNMEVTISYANAILLPGDDVNLLQMYYKEPLLGWKEVRSSHNSEGHDPAGKTITSVPEQAGFFPGLFDGVTQGQFVLAFETGCGGGGGGGLVRPSLVVNALAGVGSFSGDADFSAPTMTLDKIVELYRIDVPQEIEQMILNHDSKAPKESMSLGLFDEFDYPLMINDQGYVLTGYENTLVTQSLPVGEKVTMKFIVYETKIQHFSMYMNLRGAQDSIPDSDTQILYNDARPIQLIDANNLLEDVSVTIIEEEDSLKKEVVVELTFSKPMEQSDLIVRAWDPSLHSVDTIILDAIQVVPNIIEESPIPTFEDPIVEEITSQSIPVWVKNNAGWWSDQQIGDSDFVSGIEYLIKNEIIVVSGETGTITESTEIPHWIKNNAGWWAESLITDDDFIESMQWLIENGVIQI